MSDWQREAGRMAEVDALGEVARSGIAERVALPAPWSDRALAGLGSDGDRTAWLAARQKVATATEVAELRLHPVQYRRHLVEQKLQPPREIKGNQYIDRGHEREPVIAGFVRRLWPGLFGNDVLIHAEQNERHAATPDLLGFVDGLPVCGDIKTSKHDLRPSRPDSYFWATHYWGQLQWQMYCSGARRALFVWERHDDRWPNPEPLELEPEWEWVERDDAEIARMVAVADLMLAELDVAIAQLDHAADPVLADDSGRHEEAGDDRHLLVEKAEADELRLEVAALALAVLDGRVAEAEAKARREAPFRKLEALLAEHASDQWVNGQTRVTWSNDIVESSVLDEAAALAAHVEGLPDDVTGADLQADLERARAAWNEHQARFRTSRSSSRRWLTVTAVKPKKGASS